MQKVLNYCLLHCEQLDGQRPPWSLCSLSPTECMPRTPFLPPASKASQLRNCPWPRLHRLTGPWRAQRLVPPQLGVTLMGQSGSGAPCGMARSLLGLPCSSASSSARAPQWHHRTRLRPQSQWRSGSDFFLQEALPVHPAAVPSILNLHVGPVLPALRPGHFLLSLSLSLVSPLKAGPMLSTTPT